MKYRIVGADGQTYGPVELEQLRQWIAQGRAESRTPVFVDGATEWTFLGLLPEFAADFTVSPPPAAAPRPIVVPARKTNGFAIAGLVCGLLAWTCCCCVPFDLLGVVFSIIALIQINSQAQPQEGKAFAIIGLVLSGTNLLFTAGFGIVQMLTSSPSVTWNFSQT